MEGSAMNPRSLTFLIAAAAFLGSPAFAQFSQEGLKPLRKLNDEKRRALKKAIERQAANQKLQQSFVFTGGKSLYNPNAAPLPDFLRRKKQPFVGSSLEVISTRRYVLPGTVTVLSGGATSAVIINHRVVTWPYFGRRSLLNCSSSFGTVVIQRGTRGTRTRTQRHR